MHEFKKLAWVVWLAFEQMYWTYKICERKSGCAKGVFAYNSIRLSSLTRFKVICLFKVTKVIHHTLQNKAPRLEVTLCWPYKYQLNVFLRLNFDRILGIWICRLTVTYTFFYSHKVLCLLSRENASNVRTNQAVMSEVRKAVWGSRLWSDGWECFYKPSPEKTFRLASPSCEFSISFGCSTWFKRCPLPCRTHYNEFLGRFPFMRPEPSNQYFNSKRDD